MTLGPRSLSSLVTLPVGWDATALRNASLADGTTYEQIVSEMRTALAALNGEFSSDSLWSGLVSYTDTIETEYRIGGSNGFEVHTEYSTPDPKRADITGHMLPFLKYDRGLGWTWDYLREARSSQITADIADAIKDARDLIRVRLLTRLLKRGDDSGARLGLGTTGLSPGFATAAASTGVDYTPPSMGGIAFDSNHEHYVGITGGVFTNAVFSDAAAELAEHGHTPPYEFLIGTADEAAVIALTEFFPVSSELVQLGLLNDRVVMPPSPMGMNGVKFIGAIHNFRVWVVPGIPQYWGVGYKSYGANSARNPLKIRLRSGQSRLQVVAFPDPTAGTPTYPLQYMMLFTEFGVGINDRTAATPRYVNSATWADGTPT